MFLTHQHSVLSFSLYFTLAGTDLSSCLANIANLSTAGVIFDNAGINSVRELGPIIDRLEGLVPHVISELERLVRRVAYLLLTVQFLFFVFMVLLRYSGVARAPGSVVYVLGAGLLFFLFALWCVS